MREAIHAYACKYGGDYNKIKRALTENEPYRVLKSNSKFVTIVDDDYPCQLKELNAPPWILFYHGDLSLLKRSMVAVVGSRKMTPYAQEWTERIVVQLSKKYIIVSGLALGIDSIAHQAALNHQGKTVAVLGCGINYIYPKSNHTLYQKIKIEGLIISEFPNLICPRPYFFPIRNRIIAALSESIVVTQATKRSGTMITVNEALELNRAIYVLPYRIDDVEGAGCNELIQQGANVIELQDIDTLRHII